jgi:hypothetical protein
MRAAGTTASALLVCAAALVAAKAEAQARGPSVKTLSSDTGLNEVEHTGKLAALDVWLRRLTGRFRIVGAGRTLGTADCTNIGRGAGVHCVTGTYQADLVVRNNPFIGPSMTLYGLDPDGPGIRYLRVNNQSHAEGDLGKLSGNTVTFSRVECSTTVNNPPQIMVLTCHRRVRYYAPLDSAWTLIQTHTDMLVSIRGRVVPMEYTEDIQLQRMREPARDDGQGATPDR